MANFTYSDIVEWARGRLPEWQQDALRRVLEKGSVEADDIEELAELARAPHEGERPPGAPEAVPAEEAHARESAEGLPSVRLVAVRDMKHVNALASGPIPFGDGGLTVVYGGNASGKSGVGRILKKVCHARDAGGRILPNVFEPEPGAPASATIDFRVGDGEVQSHEWAEGGGRGNADLRTVHVFDSDCAAVQIEKANRISYTPEILQVFRSLADVTDRVASKVRSAKAELGSRPPALSTLQLDAETAAGKCLSSLRGTSDVSKVEALCTLSQEEQTRIGELDRALADDPVRNAEAVEARGRQVEALIVLVERASSDVGDAACDEVERELGDRDATRMAADAAREAFAGNSVLSGIGTEAWRALWESARSYSETHAYAGESFPVVREGAVCVLCQQSLSAEASGRLHSFEEFVKADVQQRADKAKAELSDSITSLRALTLPASARQTVRDAGFGPSVEGEALRRFLVGAKLRRRHLLRRAEKSVAGERPDLPGQPDLATVRRAIAEEAGRLRLAAQAEERLAMERERRELKAREKLAPHLELVRGEIERLRKVAELDAALEDCKTQLVTRKAGEAAKAVITDRLRSNFQTNLTELGFSESPVEVVLGAGEYGEHPYQMKLVARPDVRPEQVLSEGERTCVALAGLLAELETTGNHSALVLDDPVSSLDHQYRKRVAERLVREARSRQVISFTHDIVFLYLLRKYQSELGVPSTEVSLERGHKKEHGRASEGPPWVAMSVKDRIKWLRGELADARRALNEGNRAEYDRRGSLIYQRLRMSWERAVEEVLLNQIVVRFGDSVQTKRLSKLTDISDDDVERVTKEMSRCSDFEHDESGAVHADLPGPDVVESDIKKLDDWVKDLRKNRGRN